MRKPARTIWHFMELGSTTFALIGFGLVIRIVILTIFARLPLASDALSYHKMALQLLSNKDFPPYWPPALPYFLSFFYYIIGASEFIGRASMLLFYLIFSFSIFLLTREISSGRAANLTVSIFSIFPTFIYHSVETLTQLPTATYLVIAAYLVILIKKKMHWSYPILLGVTLALLVLTRASSIILVVLIPLYLFIKTKRLGSSLLPLLVSLIIVFGWVIKVNQMTGRWIMVNEANSVNFFIGNNPCTPLYKTWWFGSHGKGSPDVPTAYTEMLSSIRSNPPETQDKLFLQTALDHVASRPDLFLIRTANRIRNYFAFDTFTGSAIIKNYSTNKLLGLMIIILDALFYCAIMIFAMRYLFDLHSVSHQLENVVLLLALAACYAMPYWVSFSHPTYHFPIVPLFGILAAVFIENLMDIRQKKISWSWMPSGKRKYILFLAVLIFFFSQIEWVLVMWERI